MNSYDTIIVGAGPAGLFCAYELTNVDSGSRILLVDKGLQLSQRHASTPETINPSEVNQGIGGAGLFSNGALYFHSNAGGFLEDRDPNSSELLVSYIKQIFGRLTDLKSGKTVDGEERLEKHLNACGLKYKRLNNVHHLGTENTRHVIEIFTKYLQQRNVTILPNTEVRNVKVTKSYKEVLTLQNGRELEFRCDNLVLAPGKVGARWMEQTAAKLKLKSSESQPYVGVRMETISRIFSPLTVLGHDPKISFGNHEMRVKTHCVCADGYTIPVQYPDCVLVDGLSYKRTKSGRTSFNLLVKSTGINIVEGISIARRANEQGKGRPLVQLLRDFKNHESSSERDITNGLVEPTLKWNAPVRY